MAQLNPACIASTKNALFTASRAGRPKEIFDTPITVFMPRFFSSLSTCKSILALSLPVLIVSASGSTIILRFSMPYSAARAIIFSAMAIRPSAVCGMPLSSRVSATTAAPYFFTSGKTFSRLSSLPHTEFSSGLPL